MEAAIFFEWYNKPNTRLVFYYNLVQLDQTLVS